MCNPQKSYPGKQFSRAQGVRQWHPEHNLPEPGHFLHAIPQKAIRVGYGAPWTSPV